MIDPSETEQAAMAAALKPLGDLVVALGLERPLAQYSRDEILRLVEVVVDAYQAHLLEAHEQQAAIDAAYLEHLSRRRRRPSLEGDL